MEEVMIGGLIGILGVILGWILSWVDRQGRIDICEPKVRFFSFGGEERIIKNAEGKVVNREHTPGEISFMDITFTIMSFSTETKGLYQCEIKVPKQKLIKNIKQTCVSTVEESRTLNKFNQIILKPGAEQEVEFSISYEDFTFPSGYLRCYLTYKSKLGIRRKIFIGKLDFKSPLDECILNL